jgi:hypothetical protein
MAIRDAGLDEPNQLGSPLKRDASKEIFQTFKNMLTSSHNQQYNSSVILQRNGDDHMQQSTKYGENSSTNSNHLEIENKFK